MINRVIRGFAVLPPKTSGSYYRITNASEVRTDPIVDIILFPVALRPNADYGLIILEVSRSHLMDAPQSVGLLWTSDQPDAETST